MPAIIWMASVSAFEVTPQITLGSMIIAALIGVASLISVAYGAKYKVSYETADARATQLHAWLEEALAREKRLEDRLAATLAKLEDAVRMLNEKNEVIERLSQLEKLEVVINLMNENAERADNRSRERLERGLDSVREHLDQRMMEQDKRSLERHEALLGVTRTLVDRLDELGRAA